MHLRDKQPPIHPEGVHRCAQRDDSSQDVVTENHTVEPFSYFAHENLLQLQRHFRYVVTLTIVCFAVFHHSL